MILRDVNGEYLKVDVGDLVICVSSTEGNFYSPGEVFKVVSEMTITKFPVQDGDDTYGGYFGRWAVYEHETITMEDLI